MIKAKIIADSLNEATGDRLTTYNLVYPRYIHAELMTHRQFSRNAASSRAIPTKKFRDDVWDNPVIPKHWGANQKGMQAADELDDKEIITRIEGVNLEELTGEKGMTRKHLAEHLWMLAREKMLHIHDLLSLVGLHKQIANRILEPWFHIEIVCSATEFQNWFALRCHEAAHPDIQALADAMLKEYVENKPVVKKLGEWHLPYGDQEIPDGIDWITLVKVCVARCARVAYKNFNGVINVEDDLKLVDRLSASRPGHWSPFEHPAQAMAESNWSGNFKGWRQYRKLFTGENATVDLNELYARRILKA